MGKPQQLTRAQMVNDLELYWLKEQEAHPEEQMDIPAARQYWERMPLQALIYEHNDMCPR